MRGAFVFSMALGLTSLGRAQPGPQPAADALQGSAPAAAAAQPAEASSGAPSAASAELPVSEPVSEAAHPSESTASRSAEGDGARAAAALELPVSEPVSEAAHPSESTTPVSTEGDSAQATAAPEPPPAALDPWILQTRDGKFTLRIGAQLEFRYTASDSDKKAEQNSFKVNMVRPQIRATIGRPWLSVFIQPELANVPQLLDFELTAQPIPALGLKVGQFLTPFSRTFYTPVPKLLFPDFSIANNAFRADRETGAMLFGTPFDGMLEYYAGAFNGNRLNQNGNDDDTLLFIGRIAVNPLGALPYDETPALAGPSPLRLGLGVNGYHGKVPPTQASAPAFPLPTNTTPALTANPAPPRDVTSTLGVDFQLRYWLATLQGEFYYRSLDPGAGGPHVHARGAYVHASTFVYWPHVELAGRVNYVDLNTDRKADHTLAYEGLLNLYAFGNNLKLHLRYTYADNPPAPPGQRPAQHQFTAQTQWHF